MSHASPRTVKKTTPLFFVERIEPSLAFWERLGWERTVEVPHEGRLGFVILASGAHELMLQTRASLAADLPAVAALDSTTALYVDVVSLAAAVAASKGARVLVAERETFYGKRETWIVDPAGIVVGFSQPKE